MRRYLDGERPSSIFTSVGLSPAIVGRKRVERETRERLVSVQLGQIWSLTCQVFELKDRIDALERQLKEIQV